MFKAARRSKISSARLGILRTARGVVKTPVFIPVATQAVLKTLSPEEIKKLGADIILANTYHIMLRPGGKLVKKAGGLNRFMGWPGPILTDSGGFQVFSLSGHRRAGGESLVKVTDRAVLFKSYVDGRRHVLTPEEALRIQLDLGVDIAVCLDECVALPAGRADLKRSVDLTSAWAARTKIYYDKMNKKKKSGGAKTLLFAVIQGGLDRRLRLKSANDLTALDFDGYNIGGLAVGESASEREKMLAYITALMPADKPRYLMGVGYPEDIIAAVRQGVDMFDCVIPTREGRHGRLFFWREKFKISDFKKISKSNFKSFYRLANMVNAKHRNDSAPINPASRFPELRDLSKAYLHHLFKIKEPLGARLATLNNLEFYLGLMEKIRKNIREGRM